MKKRYIFLLVIVFSMIGFAMPNFLLTILKRNGYTPERTESLPERNVKYRARSPVAHAQGNATYLALTKEAITKQLKEKAPGKEFEVSKIVFTSEKPRWIAGQKQIKLSYTYQVQYPDSKPQKFKGSILLASDEDGNLFNTSE